MTGLLKNEKTFLLKLARKSIAHYLETGGRLKPEEVKAPKALSEKGACFVTLHLHGDLRGCIGSLEARRPLALDVAENALGSAFGDPRFPPLTPEEFKLVKISISVLTKPQPLPVKNPEDLLKKLVAGKHGLVIRKGGTGATFLPAVWEQLPEKEEFLSNLCAKAGLSPGEWRDTRGMKFETYEAIEFSE